MASDDGINAADGSSSSGMGMGGFGGGQNGGFGGGQAHLQSAVFYLQSTAEIYL